MLFCLPRERHQRRVERQGQEEMGCRNRSHGQDGDEIRDVPAVRDEGCHGKDNHTGNKERGENHGEFELKKIRVSMT